MGGRTGRDQLVGNRDDQVGGDREAQADRSGLPVGGGRQGLDRGVDADDGAGRVEEWAAGIAGVDGGVDLDGVGDDQVGGRLRLVLGGGVLVHGYLDGAVQCGDDAGRDRVGQAQWRADRHDGCADLEC